MQVKLKVVYHTLMYFGHIVIDTLCIFMKCNLERQQRSKVSYIFVCFSFDEKNKKKPGTTEELRDVITKTCASKMSEMNS